MLDLHTRDLMEINVEEEKGFCRRRSCAGFLYFVHLQIILLQQGVSQVFCFLRRDHRQLLNLLLLYEASASN